MLKPDFIEGAILKLHDCLLIYLLFLNSLKEFLPKEYVKNKGEKKIFQVSGRFLTEVLLSEANCVSSLRWSVKVK